MIAIIITLLVNRKAFFPLEWVVAHKLTLALLILLVLMCAGLEITTFTHFVIGDGDIDNPEKGVFITALGLAFLATTAIVGTIGGLVGLFLGTRYILRKGDEKLKF